MRSITALGGWLCAAALAIPTLTALPAPTPDAPPAPRPAATAAPASGAAPVTAPAPDDDASATTGDAMTADGEAACRRRLAVVRQALAGAEADARAATERAAAAEEETARWRRGLERAVAELNRQASRQAAPPPPPPPARRTTARSRPARRSAPRSVAARVQVLGSDVRVFGTVTNKEGTWSRGTLTVVLWHRGRQLARTTRSLQVAPGSRTPWEVRFSGAMMMVMEGSLSAEAQWDG